MNNKILEKDILLEGTKVKFASNINDEGVVEYTNGLITGDDRDDREMVDKCYVNLHYYVQYYEQGKTVPVISKKKFNAVERI